MRPRPLSFLLTWWIGANAFAQGAMTPAELDERMASTMQRMEFNAALLESEYTRLVNDTTARSNCDSMALAAYLWLHLEEWQPGWNAPFPLDTNQCSISNHSLHYTLGSFAYRHGNIEAMERHMRRALRTASSPYFEFIGWQAMGLVHQLKNQPDSAYHAFVQSYATMPEAMDAQGLNNLANAALIGEDWKSAVDWAILAEDTYHQMIRDGKSPLIFGDHFHNMVLSNRLLGEMQLQDAHAARTTFDRLQFERTDNPMAVMIGATALAYLLWQDDFEGYQATQTVLEQWAAIDSASALEVMGGHVVLLEPWKSRWQALTQQDDRGCWDAVQQLPLVFRDAAMPRPAPQPRRVSVPNWLPWTTGLCWALGSACAFWWVGVRRRIRKWTNEELVRKLAGSRQPVLSRRLAFSLLIERLAERAPAQTSLYAADLNAFETEVLADWTAGIRPKDTAKRTSRSVSTVYNARVSIRRKLNLPEGDDPGDLDVNLSNDTP